METATNNLSAQNAELYVAQIDSFENHLTATGENTEAHRKSKIDKYTRKALKSIENLLQDLPSDTSRLDFLISRYEDLFRDLSITQLDLRSNRKEITTLRRVIEDRTTHDLKNIEARKRLEVFCKELQVQNKSLKEETLSLHKQEEVKRLQVVDKFQKTLAEVNTIVQENVHRNTKLQLDKADILNRLSASDKTVQQREQQIQCLEKQLKLQEDLGRAGVLEAHVQVDDIRMAWAKERDIWQQKDKELATTRMEDKARLHTMQTTVDRYVDKFEVLEHSNTVNKEKTEKYKEDLCSTQSENISLLKRIKFYKERFAGHEKKCQELRQLIQLKDTEVKKTCTRKIARLEKLCRKLQLDKMLFLKLLQENRIEAYGQTEDGSHESQY